jgi:hypothetical protein
MSRGDAPAAVERSKLDPGLTSTLPLSGHGATQDAPRPRYPETLSTREATMRRRISLIAVAITAVFFPLSLAGQDVAPPAPRDSRVRATMEVPVGLEYVGTLESWDAESLRLSGPGGPPERLALSDLAKLEVSRGMKGNAGKGALIGAGVGLVGGIVAGILFRSEDDAYGLEYMAIAVSTWMGATALGAITGAFIKTEKWQELPIPGSR